MNKIEDYINKNINALTVSQLNQEAIDLFFELPYSHFPVLEGTIYIGCIERENSEIAEPTKKIGELRFDFDRFFVRENMIWLDVLEVFATNETNVVPVLDENNNYKGFYELEDVVRFLNDTPFLREDGGILVVKKNTTDFSMSQIAQIVETNNARVLGLFISKHEADFIEVTVKINQVGLNEIIQTFRRFEYEIISEHQEDNYLKNLKERSDYLDKYLNI